MIELVLDARHHQLGSFEVDRTLPSARRRHIGPFILLDHSGPVAQRPGHAFAVPAHPHIGLSTITYLYEGEIVHRDGLGTTQIIRPGEVNWMTAGRGIVHSERATPAFAAAGGTLHAIQLWVGLTEAHEEVEPAFQHLPAAALPVLSQPGAEARLIAGEAYGVRSPLTTFTPQFYVDVRLAQGARFALPAGHEERAAYVVAGQVRVDGVSFPARHMLVFGAGDAVLEAEGGEALVLLLGGAPITHPHMWWNFVSTRKDRIEDAKRDWVAGRFVLPPDDRDEVIPLPR